MKQAGIETIANLQATMNEQTKQALGNCQLSKMLGIQYPIIMAPMFLISNTAMVKAAMDAGITGAIPALNYRSIAELEDSIRELKTHSNAPFGYNLIVNKSNLKYRDQLDALCRHQVHYIITSLGNPDETIARAHEVGTKVFCDVTDLKYAEKVVKQGADALIAVNNRAGGHCGGLPPEELIPMLKKHFDIPVISAGGVGTASELQQMLDLGADGCSIGSIFIASVESPASEDYKQALVDYGASDIVLTEKLSGSPCTVINTPYVQKVGTRRNALETILSKNKRLKKWIKAFTFVKGMRSLRKAAFSTTYETVWCAGPSIEHVQAVRPVSEIVKSLIS